MEMLAPQSTFFKVVFKLLAATVSVRRILDKERAEYAKVVDIAKDYFKLLNSKYTLDTLWNIV